MMEWEWYGIAIKMEMALVVTTIPPSLVFNPMVIQPQGGDCNDLEATVNANATEICDGLDNNCNSIIDEGLIQALYVDADGDGYGDTNQMQTGCSEGNGLSSVYGDCDDNNAQIYPTASGTLRQLR